ncbi:MAG TPA: M13 family metallopeptidase [Candidatus Paceibacterota bacterium]|nr:M13 family metallopeptidase [Candidatus Paceibacterota bacterium]
MQQQPGPAIDPAALDHSVKPSDDFFHYVNSSWIASHPIPPTEARWGSFYVLRVEVEEQLKKIFEELASMPADKLGEEGRKVRDFYASGMDVEKLNAVKDGALGTVMQEVNGIANLSDLVRVVAFLHHRGIRAWWNWSAEPDAKASDVMALYLSQSGLSLPDRDYYLKDDEKSAEIRKKYADYAAGLAGMSEWMAADGPFLKPIRDIETELAKASMTRVELRDIEKQYNKMSPAELAAITPHVDWGTYWAEIGIAPPPYVIVCQPEFMKATDRILAETPIETLKAYLRWHVLNNLAGFLGEEFEKRPFDFYARTFGGATEMKPRWRRVSGMVNSLLDHAVGRLYVERYFSPEAKARIGALVDHLTEAYRTRIRNLDWMSDETKKKALGKLDMVARKLGFPEPWKDIAAMTIGPDSYVENYMRANMFESDRMSQKVGKPVDRTEWYMSPQTVNAYYSQLMNDIVFPAAILQPPFFYPEGDDGVNFGGIGSVIGHELTHGFDDKGSLFDGKGNLLHWWTPQDRERFEKKAAMLAEQFDRYEPLPGLHVNGKLTLGENIADLGGLLIAYDGLMLALRDNPAANVAIDGLTPVQRFFINYAITERSSVREESLRSQIQTDPHSPSEYRVNGPLSNMTAFYESFDCKKGDALWRDPEDRVNIW